LINAEENIENYAKFKEMLMDSNLGFLFEKIVKSCQQMKLKLMFPDTNFMISNAGNINVLLEKGIVVIPQIAQYEVCIQFVLLIFLKKIL
jgi:hypothetical protein